MFVVQAKMTAAGLDPSLLDTPDAPFPTTTNAGNSSSSSQITPPPPAVAHTNMNISSNASVASTSIPASVSTTPPLPPPPPPIAPAPVPAAPDNNGATASTSGGMCVKDHPDYEGFFRMLKVGVIITIMTMKTHLQSPYLCSSLIFVFILCLCPFLLWLGGTSDVCGTSQDDSSRP